MSHIIISLDGNIGAGKSTLLQEIRNKLHDVHIVDEPVSQWSALKNAKGKSLLELFYEDKNRWSYTFQNCALLTRLKNIQKAVENIDTTISSPQVIITERSVLTDKHVFAEMLYDAGNIDPLEWELYESWFNGTGEESIDLEYLDALDKQHKKWIKNTNIPVLTLSTEADTPVEENIERIRLFVDVLKTLYA